MPPAQFIIVVAQPKAALLLPGCSEVTRVTVLEPGPFSAAPTACAGWVCVHEFAVQNAFQC